MIIIVTAFMCACKGPSEAGRSLPFSIFSGDIGLSSSVREQSVVRVTNESEFNSLWSQTHSSQSPVPPASLIDFNKDILFIFLGTRPTTGYIPELKHVWETDKSIRLTIKEIVPPSGDATGQAITSPYVIVTLEKTGKPIESVFTRLSW